MVTTIILLFVGIVLWACNSGETPPAEPCTEYTEEGVIDYLNQLSPDAKARVLEATAESEDQPEPEPVAQPVSLEPNEPAPEPEVNVAEPEPPAPEPEPNLGQIAGVTPGDMTTPVSTITAACPVGLNRLLLTREIANREPVGVQPPFAATLQPLYVYMDLANANGPENQVDITWVHVPTNHGHQQSMAVGVSPNWRTWVRHRLGVARTGRWLVSLEVDGCVIGTIEFDAVAAP